MNGLKATHLLWVAVVACMAAISCSPSDLPIGSKKTAGRVLTREEIVEAANSAARQRGSVPPGWIGSLDEGNDHWKMFVRLLIWSKRYKERGRELLLPEVTDEELDAAIVQGWPMLNGHDYQVVEYTPPDGPAMDGTMLVLVDRNTGEVLVTLDTFGRVLLSEQEMIDIASAMGRRYYPDPERWVADFDEGNRELQFLASRFYQAPGGDVPTSLTKDELQAMTVNRWPVLKGRDFQSVRYYGPLADGSRAIVIDRHTGEIIVVLDAFGRILKPRPMNVGLKTNGVVTQKELIEITDTAGRQYVLEAEEWKAIVDEGNTRWREHAFSVLWQPSIDENGHPHWPTVTDDELDTAIVRLWPALKGHPYQAVRYGRPSAHPEVLDSGMVILIDKNTGEVLMAVSGVTDILGPKKGLSEQELIAIATVAARQYKSGPEEWQPIIDVGNDSWRTFVVRVLYEPVVGEDGRVVRLERKDSELDTAILRRWPMLQGRDYQAVTYVPLPRSRNIHRILIDRHSGDVLLVLSREGEVLSPKSADGKPSARRVLSAKELIDIASEAGRRYDYSPEEWKVILDEGNARWKGFALFLLRPPSYDEVEAAIVKRWPVLKDHDYQAMVYEERPPYHSWDAGLVVLIDRNTGEILLAVGNRGQVRSPSTD